MADHIIQSLIDNGDLQRIMSAQEARDFDRFTIDTVGIPSELLMENAGAAVARAVRKIMKRKFSIIFVLVGSGNNGADAVVAARHLLLVGKKIKVFCLAEENQWSAELSRQMILLRGVIQHQKLDQGSTIFSHAQLPVVDALRGHSGAIVIDGIFGAGLNRAPTGPSLAAIQWINDQRAAHADTFLVVSVDIPSGLSLEAKAVRWAHVKSDLTITFEYLKRAHISEPTKELCGKTVAVPIGIFAPSALTTFYHKKRSPLLKLFLPVASTSHKGQFGHVMIFAGHPRMLGASRLCARAVLRVGAGLVTLASERAKPSPFDLAEFMRIKLSAIDNEFLEKIDAVVVGPGLSREELWQGRALDFLNGLQNQIVVLDADALPLLHHPEFTLTKSMIIATPHAKEAADLLGCTAREVEDDRFSAIDNLAKLSSARGQKVIWLLKGATTLIRDISGDIFAQRGALPLLSAGGSGDILSGAIAGLVRQTSSPLAAAILGVSLQVGAARQLSRTVCKGLLASEIADAFPVLTKDRPRKIS